jgi:DNA repair exonuclease SbcCD ATPase subunit
MWTPIYIEIVNFKSFKNQRLDFKRGSFLIQGVNNTDEGQQNNGSGKSTIREALCYVLDLPLYTSSLTDLINYDSKECGVTFELKNTLTNDTLIITKVTPKKGSSLLKVTLNDEDQKDKFSTVAEGHKYIISLIGISKEDLINHFIISKEKYKSFFSSSDTKVKELISRFSNFNRIDGVENYVKEDIGLLKAKLQAHLDSFNHLGGKVEVLREQLNQERSKDVDSIKSETIENLNNKINAYGQQINHHKANIENVEQTKELLTSNLDKENAVLKAYKEEFEAFSSISFDKEINDVIEAKSGYYKEKDLINDSIRDIESQLKEFNKFRLELETAIEGSIECPKCLHEFIPNDEIDISEAKNLLPNLIKEIEDISSSMDDHNSQILTIQDEVDELDKKVKEYEQEIEKSRRFKQQISDKMAKQQKVVSGIEVNLSKCDSDRLRLENEIKNLEELILSASKQIEKVKAQEIETREKEIEEKLLKLDEDKGKLEVSIQEVEDKIFEVEQWIYRFKKFKSSLANESLEVISGYANMYLQEMGSNLTLTLEGFKTLKNGDIREKITPIILRNGEQQGSGSFKNFSGGERVRVDFATSILSLQNLINNSCKTGGLDLLFVDEVLEGADSLGLENIVASTSGLNKFCYIVSHVNHEKVNNNVITIEKNNGVSEILN